MNLLSVTVTSDLKWTSNTERIILKAYKRLWILRRLKSLGASKENLVEVYTTHIRPALEFAVPVWHPNLNKKCSALIERVQKCACKIILQSQYFSYRSAQRILKLQPLSLRRNRMCMKFALNCEKQDKFSNWFIPEKKIVNTRLKQTKFKSVNTKTSRLKNSPISFLTDILNTYYSSLS